MAGKHSTGVLLTVGTVETVAAMDWWWFRMKEVKLPWSTVLGSW